MNMKKAKIGCVLVARQGSLRLPGKAMAKIMGKPVIGHILDRIESTNLIDDIIIATSTDPKDDPIEHYAKTRRINVYRGHTEDVLDRLYNAAKSLDAEAIVEIGGDCPLIDSELLSHGIGIYLRKKADLVSNALVSPFTYPEGYDFILVTMRALEIAQKRANLVSQRYQPFQYFIKNKKNFIIQSFQLKETLSDWRWTLDYPEDLKFMRKIYSRLLPRNSLFGFSQIKQFLEQNPGIAKINSMRAHTIAHSTAWYTGSYVKEVHRDIKSLLTLGLKCDKRGEYAKANTHYKEAAKLTDELAARAKHLQSKNHA
jgi:spore coat polysaccharide biosynthesis protein SpsF (cytidylyltransferase family)